MSYVNEIVERTELIYSLLAIQTSLLYQNDPNASPEGHLYLWSLHYTQIQLQQEFMNLDMENEVIYRTVILLHLYFKALHAALVDSLQMPPPA